MASVAVSYEKYKVAPEEDREGNFKYISHDPSDTHDTPDAFDPLDQGDIIVESVIIEDDSENINTDPITMFPMDNENPDLKWGTGNCGKYLYFVPPEEESNYYKASNFAVLAIPSYAYDSNNYYKCSGYMTDDEEYMTTTRCVINNGTTTTIEAFLESKDAEHTLQYVANDDYWKVVCNPPISPPLIPNEETKYEMLPKPTDDPPPTSCEIIPPIYDNTWYFGLTTLNGRCVFSGKIYSTPPAGSYTEVAYNSDFTSSTTLYWNSLTCTWGLS